MPPLLFTPLLYADSAAADADAAPFRHTLMLIITLCRWRHAY